MYCGFFRIVTNSLELWGPKCRTFLMIDMKHPYGMFNFQELKIKNEHKNHSKTENLH